MRERDYEQGGQPQGSQGLGGPTQGLGGQGAGGQGLGGYGWKSEQGGQGLGQGYGQQHEQPQGPFAGRGPRGYRRSDERIREDVADRLTEHGDVDASEIELDVRDGVVTLSGTVEDRRQKRLAEDAAESVSGVVDVNNRLELRGHAQSQEQSQDQRFAGGEAQPDYAARDYASGGSDATVATGTGTREASTATAQPVESGEGREPQPVMGAGTSQFSGDQGAAPVGTVPKGSAVFTSDGQKLGEVTDGNENFLVVQKGGLFSKDILIPRAAVTDVQGERVHVSATKEEAEHLTSEQ